MAKQSHIYIKLERSYVRLLFSLYRVKAFQEHVAQETLDLTLTGDKESIHTLYAKVLDCGLEPFYEPPRKQDEAWYTFRSKSHQ